MYLHREGRGILIGWGLFLLLIGVLVFMFTTIAWLLWTVIAVLAALFLIVAQFFRVPRRKVEAKASDVLCPADGKVVTIEEVYDDEYFNEKRLQLSIFMSPLNVHVQWMPIGGLIRYVKYHPGKYLVAWHPKSSTENERTTIVVGNEKHEVLFRQIAGAVARRIRWYVEPKQNVQTGEECGFIKFGSRVDVLLPLDAEIDVEIGQKVQGRVTRLARLK
jgi:phosphatidylserine decarboxylase